MAGSLYDEGENRIANILLGATPVDGVLYLGLYKNVTEPAETVSLSDLTEVSGYGYARQSLVRGSWVITTNSAVYTQRIFLANGGNWGSIYGYFIGTTIDDSGKLIGLEHFDSPYVIVDTKGIKITPTLIFG